MPPLLPGNDRRVLDRISGVPSPSLKSESSRVPHAPYLRVGSYRVYVRAGLQSPLLPESESASAAKALISYFSHKLFSPQESYHLCFGRRGLQPLKTAFP